MDCLCIGTSYPSVDREQLATGVQVSAAVEQVAFDLQHEAVVNA